MSESNVTLSPLRPSSNCPTLPIPAVVPMPAVAAAAWDKFVLAHPQGHLLQTSAWGQLKRQFGWRDGGTALVDDQGAICAGAMVLFQQTAGLTLAYAPKGPLTNWHNQTVTAELFLQLQALCRQAGAVLLKIEPDLPDTADNRARLRSYGLQPSPQTVQPRSTIMLDICGDDDTILQRMKSKWRYNVRLAARKEISVRAATAADLPMIAELMQETGARDGFAVHSAAYYTRAYELFVPEHGVYLLAEYAGEPIAAIVVCAVGNTAYYLWGASSDRERNRMPNHALQWAGIQWAKAHGASFYDFWGIPDALGQLAQGLHNGDGSGTPGEALPLDLDALPAGDLWGVYRFKQGFGGAVVRTVGAWDLPISPVGYRIYLSGLHWLAQARTLQQEIRRYRQLSPTHDKAHHKEPNSSIAGDPAADSDLVGSEAVPACSHDASPPLMLTPIHNATAWRAVLAKFAHPHVLQSWEWGEIKAQTGWQAERYVLREQQKPVAAFQFLWRQPIPYLPLRIGYISKGPTVEWNDLDLVDQTLSMIEQLARKRNCILVKVDPDLRTDTTTGRLVLHGLARRGWLFSNEQIQFKNTALSDLAVGEEALLGAMKSKWRYNVRLAEKRGITVRAAGAADLVTFYQLYCETGVRDGFLVRPFSYYRTTWEAFLRAESDADNPAGGTLLLAEHPDEPTAVAGLFLFRYGATSWYFYGASSERRRRDMPNYLLQWEALRWSLAHGCTTYDWWGAPTEPDNPDDDMQGVWQFKQGFGATLQPHIGAWDFPVMPLRYRLYQEALPRTLQLLRQIAKAF